jgi:hypothetical protein
MYGDIHIINGEKYREIGVGLYQSVNPKKIYSTSEAIEKLEKEKPDSIDFIDDYMTLTELIEIADKYDYHIVPSGSNVIRLSKTPSDSIVQVARNEADLERLLK